MNLLLDIVQVVKLMTRNLKFTLSTILVMTTGLTVALFLYSFVYSTMYAELPYNNGESIRVIDVIENGVAYSGNSVPHHVYNDLKAWPNSFQNISAFRTSAITLTLPNQTHKYIGVFSEPEMFSVAKVTPLQGTLFTAQQLEVNSEDVIMISETVALEMFGTTQGILGKMIHIAETPYKVIAILPSTYQFPRATNVWLPLKNTVASINRGDEANVSIFGHLPRDFSQQQLNEELNQFMAELRQKHPKVYATTALQARRFQDAFLGSAGSIMGLSIELSAGLLLLLACANASNMLFARAMQRKRESAIRMAIGANPYRLFIQMMLESSLICVLSAGIALLLTYFALGYLNQTIASAVSFNIPFWWDFTLTSTLVFITCTITLVTILITGLIPAWKMATTTYFNTNQNHHKIKSGKLSQLLVTLEIFLSSCLLLLTAAFVQSIEKQNQETFGINPQGFLTASIALDEKAFKSPSDLNAYYQKLNHFIKQSEYSTVTSITTGLPAHNVTKNIIYKPNTSQNNIQESFSAVSVSSNFFSTLNIQLISGRIFNKVDTQESPLVAIVTQDFAQYHWPDTNAVGKRFKFEDSSTNWFQVIGVVSNVTYGETFDKQDKNKVIFTSIVQQPKNYFKIIIKTTGNPYDFTPQLRSVMARLPSAAAPYRIKSLNDAIEQNRASILYITKMFIGLSIVALLLALSGIYSVVSSNVLARSNEIGIRMALGANFSAIITLISKSIVIQLIIGLLIGIGLSSYTISILERLQIVNSSVFIFWLVPVVMIIVVCIATAIPLHRVLKSPPSVALRHE